MEEQALNYFWFNMSNYQGLERGEHYKICVQNEVIIHEYFRYRKVLKLEKHKRLLYIRLNLIYKRYADFCRFNGFVPLSESRLKQLVCHKSYYIGFSFRSVFYTSYKTNTSSYIIDLDMLLEKYPHLKSVK